MACSSLSKFRRHWQFSVVSVLVAFTTTEAAAEYKLSIGDSLDISAASMPEMRQRVAIDNDGLASFPLVGPLKAVGLSVSEMRAQLQDLLPSKVFRRRDSNGQEYSVIVSPDEISVSVAEYRPIYLSGDISKPGAQAYRPGLTVRQAVSLAGGYDVMRFRMENPFLAASDLRAENDMLWTELAQAQAGIARIDAELAKQSQLDPNSLKGLPLSQQILTSILDAESQRLATSSGDHERERAYLSKAVAQEDNRITVLTKQQSEEQEGTKQDNVEYENVRAYSQKGTVPMTRVTEARRLTLLSSTRVLQTTALLAQVTRDRLELLRKLERLDDARRITLLKEREDAALRVVSLKFRLSSVAEKLAYTGMIRSQLVRGEKGKPQIRLFREGSDVVDAAEDTELRPGDTVEVSLQSAYPPRDIEPASTTRGTPQ